MKEFIQAWVMPSSIVAGVMIVCVSCIMGLYSFLKAQPARVEKPVMTQPPNFFPIIRSMGDMHVRVFDHENERCYVVEHKLAGHINGVTVSISCIKRVF